MDGERFDEMTKTLTTAGSRRRLLKAGVGFVLGGLFPFGSRRRGVDAAAPAITSGPTVIAKTASSATIRWTTNVAADTRVVYGTTHPPAQHAGSPVLVTLHRLTLTGLSPATGYHYQVRSVNALGASPLSSDAHVTTCPSARPKFCPGVGCVDLQTDVNQCGGCGKFCPDDATCQGGACVCPSGTTLCNRGCKRPASSACQVNNECCSGVCVNQVCQAACRVADTGLCDDDGDCCTGGTCTGEGWCCASGKSCDRTCCANATDFCDFIGGSSTVCTPCRTEGMTCGLGAGSCCPGRTCTSDGLCCASGVSCGGVCCGPRQLCNPITGQCATE